MLLENDSWSSDELPQLLFLFLCEIHESYLAKIL